MMNRRNTVILSLCAALMLALPVVASAQTSRVEGMALQGDYIKDYTSIYTYTSSVANVGNLVYGELGDVNASVGTDRAVGAVLGNLWDGRMGTWAIHLRDQTPNLGSGDTGSHSELGSGADPNTNSFESFDIMWAKKMGTRSFGLRLNRSFGGTEFTGTDVIGGISKIEGGGNLHRNVLGFGGGVGFELNPTTNVEASVLWQQRTFLNVVDTNVPSLGDQEDGSTTYQGAVRAMWQWMPNVMVVPVFKIYSYDMSSKSTAGGVDKNTLKGWQAGVAGNWALGTNDLFVLGATVARNEHKDDLGPASATDAIKETETFAPQVFAALETHVNSWLTVRFGANKAAWYTFKDETASGAASTETKGKLFGGGNTFNMSLGTGMKFGNLQIDAVLDDNFPHHLPHFISGQTTINTFPKVTATYPW